MEKKAIIIDSNIFGKPEEYDFDDIRICTFFNSIKNISNIDIFIPNIVLEELKKHVREELENDRRKKMSKYYRDSLPKDFIEKTYEKYSKKIDKLINKYKVKIINCDDYINISEINEWYFKRLLPFEEKKQKEFPDAMIISALKRYFDDKDYKELYAISDDYGFREALKRESNFKTFKDISSARKEILGYEDAEIFMIRKYLSENLKLFNNQSDYYLSSADSSDVIEIDDINIKNLYDVDILEIEENNFTVEVKINADITGEFYVFNPYDSQYDNEDKEYYYIEYRMADKISIEGESAFLEIEKDEKNNIKECKLVDSIEIDILKYIEQMEIVYD